MKYLDKSFTIYPSVKPRLFPGFFDREPEPIDPNHKYTDIGGMCRYCTLDEKGHKLKGYK